MSDEKKSCCCKSIKLWLIVNTVLLIVILVKMCCLSGSMSLCPWDGKSVQKICPLSSQGSAAQLKTP